MNYKKLNIILIFILFSLKLINAQEWKQIIAQYKDLPNPVINVIKIDSTGNKWVGTNNGIGIFDGENWIQNDNLNSSLPDSNVSSIDFDDKGNLWVGTKNKGICVYNFQDNQQVYLR